MIRCILMTASALAVAGCSTEAPAPQEPAKAAAMQAGEWEVTARVTALQLTDKAAKPGIKVGDTSTLKGCVASDGTPESDLFAAKAKKCETVQSYAANGRLSLQMNCSRADSDGQFLPQVDATFTADTMDGTLSIGSFTAGGRPEYSLTQEISGKRIGECPAA
jgi:hypothetical protein